MIDICAVVAVVHGGLRPGRCSHQSISANFCRRPRFHPQVFEIGFDNYNSPLKKLALEPVLHTTHWFLKCWKSRPAGLGISGFTSNPQGVSSTMAKKGVRSKGISRSTPISPTLSRGTPCCREKNRRMRLHTCPLI